MGPTPHEDLTNAGASWGDPLSLTPKKTRKTPAEIYALENIAKAAEGLYLQCRLQNRREIPEIISNSLEAQMISDAVTFVAEQDDFKGLFAVISQVFDQFSLLGVDDKKGSSQVKVKADFIELLVWVAGQKPELRDTLLAALEPLNQPGLSRTLAERTERLVQRSIAAKALRLLTGGGSKHAARLITAKSSERLLLTSGDGEAVNERPVQAEPSLDPLQASKTTWPGNNRKPAAYDQLAEELSSSASIEALIKEDMSAEAITEAVGALYTLFELNSMGLVQIKVSKLCRKFEVSGLKGSDLAMEIIANLLCARLRQTPAVADKVLSALVILQKYNPAFAVLIPPVKVERERLAKEEEGRKQKEALREAREASMGAKRERLQAKQAAKRGDGGAQAAPSLAGASDADIEALLKDASPLQRLAIIYESKFIDPLKALQHAFYVRQVLTLIIAGKAEPTADELRDGGYAWAKAVHPDKIKGDPILQDVFHVIDSMGKALKAGGLEREKGQKALEQLVAVGAKLVQGKSATVVLARGESVICTDGVTAADYITRKRLEARQVIINSMLVAREAWATTTLKPGDTVELVVSC